jgi:hypothetical protein
MSLALTTVFDGTLPANPTRSAWVAVPVSRVYTITAPSGVAFEFSNDGVASFALASGAGARLDLINSGGTDQAYRMVDYPVGYMRVWWNSGGTAPAAKVQVISV